MLQDAATYGRRADAAYRRELAQADREKRVGAFLAATAAATGRPGTEPVLGVPPHPRAPQGSENGATWVTLVGWNRVDVDPYTPPDDYVAGPEYSVRARANHGRWIADCPCGGAQLACRTDHRLFCVDCLNEHVGGRWVIVVWPPYVQAVEDAMAVRPVALQNWMPGEDPDVLDAENVLLAARGDLR